MCVPQGAIQGPEEFMEGMALGVKALVGGAVGKKYSNICFPHYTQKNVLKFWLPHLSFAGGIAGAASRITGAMAKGVAAMTMDEEYQQKRRETMNKQPSGLREGLARGGKGLVSVSNSFLERETFVVTFCLWCSFILNTFSHRGLWAASPELWLNPLKVQ